MPGGENSAALEELRKPLIYARAGPFFFLGEKENRLCLDSIHAMVVCMAFRPGPMRLERERFRIPYVGDPLLGASVEGGPRPCFTPEAQV